MRRARRPHRRAAEFDMTPMIDVVMLLLVFFLFTSQFVQLIRSPIDLPTEPGEAARPEEQVHVVVDVRQDGELLIESRPLTLDRVVDYIAGEALRAGEGARVQVLVRADQNAPSRHINVLADELARLGVRDWRLATRITGPQGEEG